MSAIETLIPVTQKAPNVCGYCRTRKQACDRTIPSCSRCTAKGQYCDYTPSPPQPITTTEPSILQSGTFAPYLSSRGVWELLQSVTATLHATSDPIARSKLSDFVTDILDLANVDFPSALDNFGLSVQQWCPILSDDVFRQCAEVIVGDYPLLALGVWLVTRTALGHPEHFYGCQLYQALKQVMALLQTRSEVKVQALQFSLLTAVYEVGHGMGRQAFQTLGNCKSMMALLQLDAHRNNDIKVLGFVEWLQASLVMLDRILFIAAPSISLPLTFPPADPICTSMSAKYQPPIPPQSSTFSPTSPRKVHIRTVAALASGHALDYIHARQRSLTPNDSYDAVDNQISDCIKMLVDKPQPHTWLHCDAIALAFCSHILLQQAQVHYLAAPPQPIELHEQQEKASLALKYSRVMVWDMVKVVINKIRSEEEVARLPFAGLCCVLRAGMAVLETTALNVYDVMSREEVDGFQRIVSWFAKQWGVGRQYEARLAHLVK
ncbi:hypothetical protein BU25DRAFT_398166 [Macroventuria anomochaeta]|uniref:Uncharacterized protein n=1 Tax=Macroventuria anomochaeta TaxID=301207 RepID=A0ACB6RSN4_9PLEO|nr:uncharacterized protein BU25DRAFT_398166 [Macroventuria anomochaeta]KAF2624995.1 hypothetical protein BU25DRAFT_398166 [Macroventuria anomochaeta]